MPNTRKNKTNESCKPAYDAMVSYHNSLIQARFTVAGLVLAANGFLVSAFFMKDVDVILRSFIPPLGMLIEFICWLLEMRTYQLLENLGKRGLIIEKEQFGIFDDDINKDFGFFSLMNRQYDHDEFKPVNDGNKCLPRLIPTKERLKEKSSLNLLVSHSVGIGLLYIALFVFWLFMGYLLFVGF